MEGRSASAELEGHLLSASGVVGLVEDDVEGVVVEVGAELLHDGSDDLIHGDLDGLADGLPDRLLHGGVDDAVRLAVDHRVGQGVAAELDHPGGGRLVAALGGVAARRLRAEALLEVGRRRGTGVGGGARRLVGGAAGAGEGHR